MSAPRRQRRDPQPGSRRSPEPQPSGPRRVAATRYEDDLYTWVQEQVALLRAGLTSDLDLENIAEELGDVAKAERSKLDSILRVLVTHMLKWDQQPELRTPSWVFSIREQRRRFTKLLAKNPGLKPARDEALADVYPTARDWAAAETHYHVSEFPTECPYGWDDLLERPFEIDAWAYERK